jgi:hypothetical protein
MQMMYAASDADLDAAKCSFFDGMADDEEDDFENDPCKNYRRRVQKFLDRGDEWLLVCKLMAPKKIAPTFTTQHRHIFFSFIDYKVSCFELK